MTCEQNHAPISSTENGKDDPINLQGRVVAMLGVVNRDNTPFSLFTIKVEKGEVRGHVLVSIPREEMSDLARRNLAFGARVSATGRLEMKQEKSSSRMKKVKKRSAQQKFM